jgi:hypothetical protein
MSRSNQVLERTADQQENLLDDFGTETQASLAPVSGRSAHSR